MKSTPCVTLGKNAWIRHEGKLHAAIDGGTMLRIRNNRSLSGVLEHDLCILTDRGWQILHVITTPQVQGKCWQIDKKNEAGATNDLKAYAAFLYQGRLKRPIAAVKLHGRPLSSSPEKCDRVRSYEKPSTVKN